MGCMLVSERYELTLIRDNTNFPGSFFAKRSSESLAFWALRVRVIVYEAVCVRLDIP